MTFLNSMDPETGLIDRSETGALGKELNETYNAGEPFPHIVIDDFLPEDLARTVLGEFHGFGEGRFNEETEYDRAQERRKREYKPDQLSVASRNLFYAFNSLPFIKVLENICGIKGLIPDPYFKGGGLHEIGTGGHLSVHADFNHHIPMDLERRINLLIYLNEDWKDEFGGQLELWANDMSRCVKSVVPVFNRAVMFNTTSFSNHGNPNAVHHPEGRSRKSIALYYYTATWDETKRGHTTQFRARPKSDDKRDWSVRMREIYEDFTPPVVQRQLKKMRSSEKA